jgi:FixJ family two-component response regulator
LEIEPTVFIVDDDPAARQSVSALIESMGLLAETFASAEKFLETYDPGRPGCLVTDYRMVGMSGLDLQEALVCNKITLPVIVITAYADVPLAVDAMKRGAITLLEKPCHENELVSNIRRAVEMDARNRQEHAHVQQIQERLATLSKGELEVTRLRTVELRRHQIMKKMRVDSVAQLVKALLVVGDIDQIGDETD